jgi:hypothetical protein
MVNPSLEKKDFQGDADKEKYLATFSSLLYII